MDSEQTLGEIEWLERVFAVPDNRSLNSNDLCADNRRHDEVNANSPWFRLWQGASVAAPKGGYTPTRRERGLDLWSIQHLRRDRNSSCAGW
jgi:hypothetical protein